MSDPSLRDELQRLRQDIRAAIKSELRSAGQTKLRDIDPRKAVIANLLQNCPKMKVLHVCREMDRIQALYPGILRYRPLPEWRVRLWCDAYRQVTNKVESYVSKIRRDRARYLPAK
jgi:hypothetical protein